MDLGVITNLLTVLGIGAFIGLEREYHREEGSKNRAEREAVLGVRTFALTGLLGGLAGLLFTTHQVLFILISALFALLSISNYIINSIQTKDSGTTTELANVLTFVLGATLTLGTFSIQLILALTVIVALVLARKAEIKALVSRVHRYETNAFINYAVIALVILPFLPDGALTLLDIPVLRGLADAYHLSLGAFGTTELLNPYKMWFIVALITGIDVVGYVLTRLIGANRGWLAASIVGGFVSSTATTHTLVSESKNAKNVDRYVAAAMLATTVSFLPLFFLIAPVNSQFLVRATPVLVLLLVSTLIVGLYFWRASSRVKTTQKQEKADTEVFSIKPALKFALIFLIIRFVTRLSIAFFGNSGLLASAALAGLTGMDAITLNIADLTINTVTTHSGVLALLIANATNLIGKAVYAYTSGSRAFAYKYGIGMGVVILLSFVSLLLV